MVRILLVVSRLEPTCALSLEFIRRPQQYVKGIALTPISQRRIVARHHVQEAELPFKADYDAALARNFRVLVPVALDEYNPSL
jgi:hypothetical protein